MNHQEIQAMLLRYRQGKCTEEEVMHIHRWYDSLNMQSRLTIDEHERGILEDRLLENIQRNIFGENAGEVELPKHKWWLSSVFYSGIAAVLVMTLTYTYFFKKTETKNTFQKETIRIHKSEDMLGSTENTTDKDQKLVLEDKSVVVLSPGSRIVYPVKFEGSTREVQLTGDAFFEITKNPEKPFLIYSGKLITRVLGTSFRIKSKTEYKQEVEVVTGKVSVFENRESFTKSENEVQCANNNGVILTPNQKATYFTESRHWITGLVENPVLIPTISHSEQLVFNNTILPDIIAGLQQEYGIEIVLGNENLEKCTFTGDLSDLPLYDKLDLICKSNASAFEVKGTRILINGTGCEDISVK